MSPNIIAVLFPVVIGLMMVPLVHAWRQQRQQRKAADWPSVEGRIESVDVVLVGGGRRRPPAWVGEIAYSYVALSQRFGGHCTTQAFLTEEESWDFVRDLKGKTLTVQYDPSRPNTSVVFDLILEERPRMR